MQIFQRNLTICQGDDAGRENCINRDFACLHPLHAARRICAVADAEIVGELPEGFALLDAPITEFHDGND